MSGGSWDHSYMRVQDLAERMKSCKEPLRRAFAMHLYNVAEALRAVEWVDSGDSAQGSERAAIKKVLGENGQAVELEIIKDDAKQIIEELKRLCGDSN